MRTLLSLSALLLLLHFASCRPEVYTPKPPGYYRIDTAERHVYRDFDSAGFPYTFRYPVYGSILVDSTAPRQDPDGAYWVNVDFHNYAARIYLSYKHIDEKQPLMLLLNDAHTLSHGHDKKADFMNTAMLINKNGVRGWFWEIGGNTASPYQFIATDSVRHFMRGALYFEVTPNSDSMQPIRQFLKQDLDTLINSLRWKE